jgi:hypothetical protein
VIIFVAYQPFQVASWGSYIASYYPQLDSLGNGSNVFVIGQSLAPLQAENYYTYGGSDTNSTDPTTNNWYKSDSIHLNAAGNFALGSVWAQDIEAALNPLARTQGGDSRLQFGGIASAIAWRKYSVTATTNINLNYAATDSDRRVLFAVGSTNILFTQFGFSADIPAGGSGGGGSSTHIYNCSATTSVNLGFSVDLSYVSSSGASFVTGDPSMLSQNLRNALRSALSNQAASTELVNLLTLVVGDVSQSLTPTDTPTFAGIKVGGVKVIGSQQAAITSSVVTATAGSLPTVTGSSTVANAATPTNAELLKLVIEQKAVVDKLVAALHAHGLTA